EEKTIEQLNDLRLAVATARQRQENLEAQRQPMAARDTELVELMAARKGDIASYENKLTTQAHENRDAEVEIREQTARAAAADAKARQMAGKGAGGVGAVKKRKIELRELRGAQSELKKKRGKKQVRESQLKMKIENLAKNFYRRYQV